jgi:hypothetical protein
MYIRKVTHTHKKNQHEYHTYKLVESVRTERGPRQRMLLNLGTDFTLPEEKWKDLANRIEEIITGQECLFVYSEEIETLARRYARKIISYQGQQPVFQKSGVIAVDSPDVDEPDYHRVDINTLENEHPRPVGPEYVIHETIKELELDKELTALGFNKPALDVTIGVIAARLVAPSSERATHVWLQRMTGIEDLLETDFGDLSQDRVYKVSDMLLRRKTEIEEHLRVKECSLFNLEETILLYDLTNTFFEGTGKYNSKAHFGHSKEKRSDCPLVTLGLVLDAEGFPKRSDTFDGNVSEPGTLEGMIHSLSSPDMLRKPLIVVDAGLATEANLQWLKDHRYGYIVVSRKKKTEMPQGLEMVTVREDNQRLIRAALMNNQDTQEIELYCHSNAKEAKEEGIKNRFEKRFEEELKKVRGALGKKRGTKRYEKVLEKIGRLKERFKRVARCYKINVDKEDKWGCGDAGKKVTKSYSINCNPFSRAIVSPLSTENPTPGELISNRLASSLSDIPNSLTAQKQKRLPAFTFRCCLPLENISRGSIPYTLSFVNLLFYQRPHSSFLHVIMGYDMGGLCLGKLD